MPNLRTELQYGETVYWEFIGLEDLAELMSDEIGDGTEITSFIFRSPNPSELVRHKDKLNIFWVERNQRRTAKEILNEYDTSD